MVSRHLQRRTSSKPIVGHRAAFNEEAVDHRCANAGPALTQRSLSILCYWNGEHTFYCLARVYSNLFFWLCIAEQQTDLHNKTYVVVILGL